jgi:hypothetical protein
MYRLTSVTFNGMPLPALDAQATVSIDAPHVWFPTLSHDQFGIRTPQSWVSPTLLKIAKPFDGSDFEAFRLSLLKQLARSHGIPWEYLTHLERVS